MERSPGSADLLHNTEVVLNRDALIRYWISLSHSFLIAKPKKIIQWGLYFVEVYFQFNRSFFFVFCFDKHL